MRYLLSVVIPTKDRYQYLKECIKTLLDIKSELLEIVIQDNTEENEEFLDFLNKVNSKHIKYYYEKEHLTVSENSSLAISHATGKYVCFIGDDDSLTTAIMDVVAYLDKNNIKACVNDVAMYHWPDIVYEGKEKPCLSVDICKCKIKKIDARSMLAKVLKDGVQDIKYLARAYHGIVSKDILDKVYQISGTYFPGPSPDMANAVACTILLDEYIYIRLPLIVSGYSYKSGGGMGLRGAHKGDLASQKHLPKDVVEKWRKEIPLCWLQYTIWPQSGLDAMDAMGEHELVNQMNYYAMHAKTYLRYSDHRKIVNEYTKGFGNKCRLLYEMIRFTFRWTKHVLYKKLLQLGKKNYREFIRFDLDTACKKVNRLNQTTAFQNVLEERFEKEVKERKYNG